MKIKRGFSARAVAAGVQNGELVLYLYDDIGAGWFTEGVTAKGIANEITKAGTVSRIVMHINSPGGDVFEGIAIYNLVKQQGVPVTVIIDGLAASAASLIAMVGDDIKMGSNAMMMIHNAWTISVGDAAEMRKTADLLDKISGVITDTYAKRTEMAAAEVKALMDAETWMTADEAVANGFADSVLDTPKDEADQAAAMAASFDLDKRFAKVPDQFKAPAAAAEAETERDADMEAAALAQAAALRDTRALHAMLILKLG
jgi:ATP-dependent Clp protease protease subunit